MSEEILIILAFDNSNMSWIRKTAIVTGVVVGITAGTVGMLTVSHRSEAAIAVIDQKISRKPSPSRNSLTVPSQMSRNGAMAETSAVKGDTPRMAGQTAQAQGSNSASRPESMARVIPPQMQTMDTGRPASSMLSRDGSSDKKNSGRGDRRRHD